MKKLNSFCTENFAALALLIFAVIFPFINSVYSVDKFTNFYIACLLSFSITLIWGYTGIFSFGQAAFFGVGAYTYAIISQCSDINLTLLGVFLGILVPFLIALVIGYFIFYGGVNEIFTGIITLCISLVFQTFMVQTSGSQYTILGVWLGGFNGLNNIPKIQVGDFIFKNVSMYVLVIVIVGIVYIGFRLLSRSGWGYAMFGIRESKARSELFGYKTAKIQTLVFGASGALAGLGGTLFASWSGYVVPSTLSVASSTVAVVMVAVAGRKNITGAMIMTVTYSWFTQKLVEAGSLYSNIIMGILLILAVMYMQNGILEEIFKKTDRFGALLLEKLKKQTAVSTAERGGA